MEACDEGLETGTAGAKLEAFELEVGLVGVFTSGSAGGSSGALVADAVDEEVVEEVEEVEVIDVVVEAAGAVEVVLAVDVVEVVEEEAEAFVEEDDVDDGVEELLEESAGVPVNVIGCLFHD